MLWVFDWTCDPIHSQPIGMPSQSMMLKKAMRAMSPALAAPCIGESVTVGRG